MNRRIHLHIDRLSLQGLDPGNRDRLVAAIERELVSRLSAPGATEGLTSARVDRIDGGRITQGDPGSAIGARIGEAISGGSRR
ncbi:hypothetical protein ACFB49_00550 [Sphingomonas sp. DBB INV C78]|uniref:hypothetical protein n=1 Tax=Sphingomonas sp. DBB INV C78 TaxID=3349434 RepID=UPI0036D26B17